ncbi:FAD-dependent oxidoreductase [Lacibacter sp. MH-610]|uniref:FAD-dependent oxidoreductase n=1 Tax=Lacibacter sp. MH-610 TaxID=3020883 RepID=UPI0038928C2E
MKLKQTLLLLLITATVHAQTVLRTEVLVIGGGTGGCAAGIQSARMGVNTIIAEPTVWLGGMFSAAGVAAFDGNHNMPSGIWGEFREQLYKVYGGPNAVATGWVSNTQFEPHVGDSIIKSFVSALPNLKVLYQTEFVKAIVNGNTVTGALFVDVKTKKQITIYAKQVIDATELGDVLASAKIPFDMGMEASSVTGENINVPETNDIIQDMTYAAILKDYGKGVDRTLPKPANYNPLEFDGCNNEFSSTPEKITSNVTAQKMLDYGKLPNGKYMINWPGKGNDIYINMIPMNAQQRKAAIQQAKAKTIRFIYFLQTQFGFKHLDLADDEFPTADKLPLIPYHRESRRVKGLVRFKIQHIAQPFTQAEALYRTGIAVGDYPIDHHHRENLKAPQHLGFYPVPSFNVPLGALIPQTHNGIIIAEKSISVSNVVNGTTRLQPCVMMTGQAAGTLAALAVKKETHARVVEVREVQQQLLNSKAYIMPYYDVKRSHPHFGSIQRIGATGILKGKGEPYQWANRTWFYPDSTVKTSVFLTDVAPFIKLQHYDRPLLTIDDAVRIVRQLGFIYQLQNEFDYKSYSNIKQQIENKWSSWGLKAFDENRNITRAELAVLLDQTINPFQLKQVNHNGQFK